MNDGKILVKLIYRETNTTSYEIVRSYQEFSEKNFIINSDQFKNPVNTYKSSEIVYGLRNFIGNANKFSNQKVEVFLKSNKKKVKLLLEMMDRDFLKI